ncbi:MAG: hypothetical protein ABI672_12505 [Vicinamibacteria bacterium]
MPEWFVTVRPLSSSHSLDAGNAGPLRYDFDGFVARFSDDQTRRASIGLKSGLVKKDTDGALGTVLHLILRREGRLDLHSAAVSRNRTEPAVLFIGAKGVGKSSLTVTLAGQGWSFLSDDYVLAWMSKGSLHAGGLRTPLYLTEDARARLPAGVSQGRLIRSAGKWMFQPAELFPEQHRAHAAVGAIVFPQLVAGSSKVERLRPMDAFQRLLTFCPFLVADPAARPCLEVARALADRPAYALHAGPDLLESTTALKIMELVTDGSRIA